MLKALHAQGARKIAPQPDRRPNRSAGGLGERGAALLDATGTLDVPPEE